MPEQNITNPGGNPQIGDNVQQSGPQLGGGIQQSNPEKPSNAAADLPPSFGPNVQPADPGRYDSLPVGDWDTFYTSNTVTMYLPAYKQVVFIKDATGDATQPLYLFDIPTRSWVYGNDQFTTGTTYSNAVIDSNGNTVFLEGGDTIKQWSATESAPTNEAVITFKDETFGYIGVKKKVYSVAIKYKASATFTDPLDYAVDGSETYTTFATQNLASTSNWDIAVFTPSTPITCESIQFRLNNLTSGTVEIDDLSIEYRVLPYARVT